MINKKNFSITGLIVLILVSVSMVSFANVDAQTNKEDRINEQLVTLNEKALPYPDSFEDLGLSLEYDQPEGAILAMTLPDVYILPDSKLYFIVKFWESLQLLWADTIEEKSDLLFYFAEVRLAETIELIDNNNSSEAITNLDAYRGQLSQAVGYAREMDDDGAKSKSYNKLEEQVWYQRALSRVIKAEGISDVFNEISLVFVDNQSEKSGLELQEVQ